LALGAGIALMIAAVSRFEAAVTGIRAQATFRAIQNGDASKISTGQLDSAIASAQSSLRLVADPDVAAALGRLQLAGALAIGLNLDAGKKLLTESRAATRLALMLAPGLSFEWLQLSYVELLGPSGAKAAAGPLAMSLNTGRSIHTIIIRRLDLAFTIWNDLNPATQSEVDEQTRIAMRTYPYWAAVLGQHFHRILPMRRLLQDEPEALAEFDRRLLQIPPDGYHTVKTVK
jgi:hypothetical protein